MTESRNRRAGGCALQGRESPRVAQRCAPALGGWAECAGPSITTALEAAAGGDMESRRVVEARDHLERAEAVLAGVSGETARWAREAIRGVTDLLEQMEVSGVSRTPVPARCGCGGCLGEAEKPKGAPDTTRLTEEIRISRVPWGEVAP